MANSHVGCWMLYSSSSSSRQSKLATAEHNERVKPTSVSCLTSRNVNSPIRRQVGDGQTAFTAMQYSSSGRLQTPQEEQWASAAKYKRVAERKR